MIVYLSHSWTKIQYTNKCPSPRSKHRGLIFESMFYIFGGLTTDMDEFIRKDLFRLDLCSYVWMMLHIEGDVPEARILHGMERVGDCLVIFGGSNVEVDDLNDTYIIDGVFCCDIISVQRFRNELLKESNTNVRIVCKV